jgi:hypothetical protein
MNRHDYRRARRLIRDNGIHALRWLTPTAAGIMGTLSGQRSDPLSYRLWCLKEGAQRYVQADIRYCGRVRAGLPVM